MEQREGSGRDAEDGSNGGVEERGGRRRLARRECVDTRAEQSREKGCGSG